jgi:hypothetical protein
MKTFIYLALILSSSCFDDKTTVVATDEKVNNKTILGQGFVLPLHNSVNNFPQNPHNQFNNQFNNQIPNQNNNQLNPYSSGRNDLFNVAPSEIFYPAECFLKIGAGLDEIREASSTVKVIYFSEEVANPNVRYFRAPPRKFFIVFSLNFGRERFIGAELMIDPLLGNKLIVQESLCVNNLLLIKNHLNVNYFPPEMQRYYQNLKQDIINKLNQHHNNNKNNFQPVLVNNYNDPFHPLNALKLTFQRIDNFNSNNITVLVLLNYVQYNDERAYLFRLKNRNGEVTYLGVRMTVFNGQLTLVGFCLDRKKANVTQYLDGIGIVDSFSSVFGNLLQNFQASHVSNNNIVRPGRNLPQPHFQPPQPQGPQGPQGIIFGILGDAPPELNLKDKDKKDTAAVNNSDLFDPLDN